MFLLMDLSVDGSFNLGNTRLRSGNLLLLKMAWLSDKDRIYALVW